MNKIKNITNATKMKNERSTIKKITGDLGNASKKVYCSFYLYAKKLKF